MPRIKFYFTQLIVLLNIYLYTIILAATIFEDQKWSSALYKSLPIFLFLAWIWLYYQGFKIIRYTFYTVSGFLLLLVLLTWQVSYTLGTHVYDTIPVYKNTFRWDGYASIIWSIIRLLVSSGIIAFIPIITYLIFLRRGFNRKCPVCNNVDGLYARKIYKSELLSTNFDMAIERSNVRVIRPNGVYVGDVSIDKSTRYRVKKYKQYCLCNSCGHKWEFVKTNTIRL